MEFYAELSNPPQSNLNVSHEVFGGVEYAVANAKSKNVALPHKDVARVEYAMADVKCKTVKYTKEERGNCYIGH